LEDKDVAINNQILSGTRANDDVNPFSIYENAIYGIEIQYPSKWEKIDLHKLSIAIIMLLLSLVFYQHQKMIQVY
jgi:hypothetical protein